MQVLGLNVLVKNLSGDQKSSGGIVIPTAAQESRTQMAEVLEIGDECSKKLAIGQKIMYYKNTGIPVQVNAIDFFVVAQKEIMVILD